MKKATKKIRDSAFVASFIIGLMIYITLAIYGQQIMAAVVEEKETRIAEILFSSAKPFELMMGKLVGVGLAGLTQLAIWIISALILVGFGLAQMSAAGMNISIPDITPLMVVYFFIFFLLGFFIYASIFALIGSMVTTVQEGGQFAISADYDFAYRVLFQLCRHPRPEFDAFVLGFDRAVFRADYDARADFGGNAAVLADRAVDFC